MVEGGARISAAMIRARLVDRIHWFRAGLLLGGDGVAAVAALGLNALADAPRLEFRDSRRLGEDVVETYAVRR